MKVRPEVEQIISSIKDHPEDWRYKNRSMVHKDGADIWAISRRSVGIWAGKRIFHSIFSKREKRLIWKVVKWFLKEHHFPKQPNTNKLILNKTIKSIGEQDA